MKWKRAPRRGNYKLVATLKQENDIGIIVLCPDRRNYSWNNVPELHNVELREYLLSLKEGIEKGWYDVDLLEQEIN
ncbi:hypothetical protein [Virgibacillus doumboii]|uniref:hypothetical protein n=1 Tax=Virgibacillus doumboii TaxID=2697503 RepID=UPI0013DFBB5A|nr:hypothetical protein [Virgibacillus doumboii]